MSENKSEFFIHNVCVAIHVSFS